MTLPTLPLAMTTTRSPTSMCWTRSEKRAAGAYYLMPKFPRYRYARTARYTERTSFYKGLKYLQDICKQ